MADESQYSDPAHATTASTKRKYDDQTAPPLPRRPTGFSSPVSSHAPPPSYNSVPPVDEIQIAKQKAQEIAARLLSGAPAELKRPRVDNGASDFDSYDKGFSSAPSDLKSMMPNSVPSAIPASYGSYTGGTSKKIDIPSGRVGVIIGKGGETIKYLQHQSGAKIQVTRDADADPNSPTRMVELMGTPDQIAKAEQLINDVIAEADAGGSGTVSRRFSGSGQSGSEHFSMKIANNKVGLVIGKGGETIKNMQARSGARIQVIPLHLPPGDMSTERTVHVEGTVEQIETAKQLIYEVTSENRSRNPSMGGGYPQQGYQTRPPANWGQNGAPPVQQSGYGYMQTGAYPGPPPQYNMRPPPYAGYQSQPSSGGYPSNWDQSNVSANQQTSQGYDYYSQQPPSQHETAPGGPAAPSDNSGYNYSHPPASGYNQQGQAYGQDGYGAYAQGGYGQAPPYDQQQGYTYASNYGNAPTATQDGQAPAYGAQADSAQAPAQSAATSQQVYPAGQQPSSNQTGYQTQGATQPGYGLPPTSQPGYGNQAPGQYGSGYGAHQTQKPSANPPVYGQTQQSPSTPGGGYGQTGQSGYPHSQPATGYAQPDSGSQRTPPSGFSGATAQPGYGPPSYGAPPVQPGYGQGQPPPYSSYGSGCPQPGAYTTDGSSAPASQSVQPTGAAKTSPQS